MRVEEEREPRCEVVDREPPLERPLDVREPVLQRERELLRRRRARLADVVAGDRDRVPQRHLARAELDHVRDEPHGRLGREDVLLLRDVLLEDVRLDRAAQRRARDALLLGDADVEGEQHRRGRVDRHRRRHLAERDAREQQAHVLDRVDRDALPPDLAERPGVVGVEAHQRRHVERRREAGLTVVEQEAEPLVRLVRRPEPRELAHRPEATAVHRRVDAARERELARVAEIAVVVDVDGVGRRERRHVDPRERREELARAVGRAGASLPPAVEALGCLRLSSTRSYSRRAGEAERRCERSTTERHDHRADGDESDAEHDRRTPAGRVDQPASRNASAGDPDRDRGAEPRERLGDRSRRRDAADLPVDRRDDRCDR